MVYTPPTGAGNVVSNSGASGASLTVNKPANLADGDLLVLVAYKQLGGSTFTTPSGFTSAYVASAASTRGFQVFGKKISSAGSEPSSYSVTSSDSSSRWILVAFRLPDLETSWLDAAPASDVYVTNTGTITDPTVTAVSAHTLALAFNFTNNSTAVYQTFSSAGWTGLVNATATVGSSTSVVDVQYKELTASGATGGVSFSMTPNAASAGGFLLAFALPALPSETKVRWGRSEFEGDTLSVPKVRWGRSEFEGTAPVTPKVRWGRSEFEGVTLLALEPFTDLVDVEPETIVTLTANVSAGTPDFFTWRQISGPTVSFSGSGGTRSFRAPSAMNGSLAPIPVTVVVGVTATSGSTTSPERTVSVSVLPQTRWYRSAGQWLPMRPVVEFAGA